MHPVGISIANEELLAWLNVSRGLDPDLPVMSDEAAVFLMFMRGFVNTTRWASVHEIGILIDVAELIRIGGI
jgi:hypothetical protein